MLNVAARRASGLINMNLTRGRPLQIVLAFSNQLIELQTDKSLGVLHSGNTC